MTAGELIGSIRSHLKGVPDEQFYPLVFVGPLVLFAASLIFWKYPLSLLLVSVVAGWIYLVCANRRWDSPDKIKKGNSGYFRNKDREEREGRHGSRVVHHQALYEAENSQFWEEVGKEAERIIKERERFKKAVKEEFGIHEIKLGACGSEEEF